MTVNLIPQDKLTLDLLIEVLAKMYRYSLNSKDDAPDDIEEPRPDVSGIDFRNRYLGYATFKRDSVQIDDDDDCVAASHSRLMAVSAREGTLS